MYTTVYEYTITVHKVTLHTGNIPRLLPVWHSPIQATDVGYLVHNLIKTKHILCIKRFCLRYVYLNPIVQAKH